MESKNTTLMERLIEYMGRRFEEDIEGFFADNCHLFIGSDPTEHKLEHTSLHKEYESLVECHLEKFVEFEGTTIEQFYNNVNELIKKDNFNQAIMEMVLASSDYEFFVMLMRARSNNSFATKTTKHISNESKSSPDSDRSLKK